MTGNTWDVEQYASTFDFVARHGYDVLALLEAKPGERVLDLGCGTGEHARVLAQGGVEVVGIDASEEMLATARASEPQVEYHLVDVTRSAPELGLFDAVFSNAALHWMQPQSRALAYARACLRPGGRFVAEMGGQGNIATLDRSFRAALREADLRDVSVVQNWFPTIGQQSALLEEAGFRVESAHWFRRPTPLKPGVTAADWVAEFRADAWQQIAPDARRGVAQRINDLAAPELLTSDGWVADYCRLRFVAVASAIG